MARRGLVLSLALPLSLGLAACEKSEPSNNPEPAQAQLDAEPEPAAEAQADAEPEPATEAQAEPAPEAEPAPTREVNELSVSRDGFEARHLQCTLNEAMSTGAGYIMAGLSKQDAAFDGCAPGGAAIEVEWAFAGSQTAEISVVAENSKLASCIASAMAKVRAGVGGATCKVVLLVGDDAAAQAAFDAR